MVPSRWRDRRVTRFAAVGDPGGSDGVSQRVLYLVVYGAGPASRNEVMVQLAQAEDGRCTAWRPRQRCSTSWTSPTAKVLLGYLEPTTRLTAGLGVALWSYFTRTASHGIR